MRRGIAHSSDTLEAGNRSQEPGEVPVREAIRIHGLAQKRELADPVVGQLLNLCKDESWIAVLLVAASVRDDAVGAAVVAAPLDWYPGRDPRLPPYLEPLVVLGRIELDIDHAAVLLRRLLDDARKRAVGVGPNHHIHELGALDEPGTQPLGHAATHPDEGPGAVLLHTIEL